MAKTEEEKKLLLGEQGQNNGANLAQAAQSNLANAQMGLNNVMQGKPANYQSGYQDQIKGLYNNIMNRPKFNYSINDDPLYQQYKQQYMTMGKQAMRDTTAQAAALTGGYGNSYGAAAGNQAYQGYLERMNAMVPELEGRAFERYKQEGNDLYDQLSAAQQGDQIDYGRWQDQYNQWADQRDYYTDQMNKQGSVMSTYYNLAMSMLGSGVTPNAEILRQAGLTPEDAAEILRRMNAGTGAGGGDGGDGNGNKNIIPDIVRGMKKGINKTTSGDQQQNATAVLDNLPDTLQLWANMGKKKEHQ